jgi:hypothetical protein
MQDRGVWGSANYFEWPQVADAVIEARGVMANNMEEYLAKGLERSITEHVLCTRRAADGGLVFYIHPLLRDGDTLDFAV